MVLDCPVLFCPEGSSLSPLGCELLGWTADYLYISVRASFVAGHTCLHFVPLCFLCPILHGPAAGCGCMKPTVVLTALSKFRLTHLQWALTTASGSYFPASFIISFSPLTPPAPSSFLLLAHLASHLSRKWRELGDDDTTPLAPGLLPPCGLGTGWRQHGSVPRAALVGCVASKGRERA